LGNLKDAGRTDRRKGKPVKVKTHDFLDKELGKTVPYGVYDIATNEAGVTVQDRASSLLPHHSKLAGRAAGDS
jgi:hypothetical protein